MQTSYTHLSWSKLACASGASGSKHSSKAELCLLVVELQQFTVDLITVFVRDFFSWGRRNMLICRASLLPIGEVALAETDVRGRYR